MENTTCCYVLNSDSESEGKKKQSIMDWLRTLVQAKPKLMCKTVAECDICSMCASHCLTHNSLRSHLDRRYKPTLWSTMGDDKNRKASYRIPAYQARGKTL